jgi:hypothetical protein
MFDFIPIEHYTFFYYQILLVFLIGILLHAIILEIDDIRNTRFLKVFGYVSLVFVLLYMGLRPIHSVFVDMTMYAYSFERYVDGNPLEVTEDFGFYWFLEFSAKVMSVGQFFFVCSLLYVVPLYLLCVRWFKAYWFYAFFAFIVSFSFWAYGTNGIRNGLATSLFLLALSFKDKKVVLWTLLLISLLLHKTMILPLFAFIVSSIYNKSQTYLFLWFFSIVVSLVVGNFFVEYLEALGVNDRRFEQYFTDEIDEAITKTGFRWDFLLYSATGVFAGWYYIYKKKFLDATYEQLFNMYLIANAFWVLVIRANFTNRFAYLSWFMLALIIFYPILKEQLFKQHHRMVSSILLLYFMFTYIFNVILVK